MRRPFKLFSIAAIFALLVNSTPLSTARASETNNAVQRASSAPLLVPDADTALSTHPLERVMIGEDFEFRASFDNSAETGFGPFIDLIFPTNGADGAAGTDTPDGITFFSGQYDGYTMPSTSLIFPDDDGP